MRHRKWYWAVVPFVVLCIGCFVFFSQKAPQEPIKIYKATQPRVTAPQRPQSAQPTQDVSQQGLSTESLTKNPVLPVDMVRDGMTRDEVERVIQAAVQAKTAPYHAKIAELQEELAQKKAELAAAEALEETAAWMREFRVDFHANLAFIRSADVGAMSEAEQLELLDTALGLEGRLNEMFERIAALPKLAREQVLEDFHAGFSNPATADYVLAEINRRVRD